METHAKVTTRDKNWMQARPLCPNKTQVHVRLIYALLRDCSIGELNRFSGLLEAAMDLWMLQLDKHVIISFQKMERNVVSLSLNDQAVIQSILQLWKQVSKPVITNLVKCRRDY